MIDRDTVIQGLTKQIDFAKKIGNRNITLYVNQAEDILELLKEQEAKPTPTAGANNVPLKW